ncbi:MAG: hypothetical protein M1820_009297 [Bogoriella megaspora]|nr:MAG: hypothetical protein M1820_009297 [Bogoriella megaspora]
MPQDREPGDDDGGDSRSSRRLPWDKYQMGVESKIWLKRYRTEVAASSSSLVSTFVAYPLDSIKTRMQAYKFDSVWDCTQHTYKTEGTAGCFRGVLAPLASIAFVRTVSFSIYQRAKYMYDGWIYKATGSSPLEIANTDGALPTLSTVACFGAAGATAGAAVTAIACPFELTKLSSQLSVLMANNKAASQINFGKLSTYKTSKKLIQQRGFIGLYYGFQLHILRDTIGTAIYFMTYESAKQLLANARGNSPTSPGAVVAAGGLCGLVSWACIYPIDSAKSIYQRNCLETEPGGKPSMPKIQFINRRMYRGLGVSMSRSAVINAVFFSVFEFVKKRINRLEIDEPHKVEDE